MHCSSRSLDKDVIQQFAIVVMKSSLLLLYVTVAVVLGGQTEDDAVAHLETLLQEYLQNNTVYQFPKDNSDFFDGLTDSTIHDYGRYDFIVIGSGSSGSVVASRLSEISDWRVLLLEAGGEEDAFSDVPGVFGYLQGSRMNWGYLTTPQRNACLGMKNRQCAHPRGKVVGGSSTINAVMYVRGNRADYDLWEQLGNEGWNYEKILPYFLKSEDSQILYTDYHGNDGPLYVDYAKPPSRLLQSFLDANKELGREFLDYNGRKQLGYSRTQLNIKHGKRVSGGNAYVKEARTRPNLEVSTNSLVTRVLTDSKSKFKKFTVDSKIKVSGVEFIKDGKKYRAGVEKEVILSAGTFNSPQILQLSGLGPKEDLRKLGVPLVKNLPAVGKYLKDHPVHIGLVFQSEFTEDVGTLEQNLRQYLKGEGRLTTAGPTYGIGFIETKDVPNGVPDVEYLFLPPMSKPTHPQVMYNFKDDILNEYNTKLNKSKDIVFYLVLLHPKSTGQVTLKSGNARDFPDIDINYFSDEEHHDLETLYRGIQFIFELVNTAPFQQIGIKPLVLNTDCDAFGRYSKAYWYCYIRTMTSTLYHPTGTTRMGTNQTTSVVDNKLFVHGMENLRVADAGVMPSTVSGHTNAACFMIGERVSYFIKHKYGKI